MFVIYSISFPYTSFNSVIGINIDSSFSIACAYVATVEPFISISFSSKPIVAILSSYVVIILLFSSSSYIYLSKKFDKSCFDKYILSPSINTSCFKFPVTFVLFITKFVVLFLPSIM